MVEKMQSGFFAGVKRLLEFAALRRLVRQQDGAAAVEFALVAAPFLALLFAILETALVFFSGQTLETAAVEFALVAAPFLALTFAILETAMVFFAGQTLEAAAADSARLIMTGQAQSAGFSQAQFKSAVCARIYGLFDCANGVYVNVKSYSSFGSISSASPVVRNSLGSARREARTSSAAPWRRRTPRTPMRGDGQAGSNAAASP